jgi:hypothetical protein
MLLNKAYYTFKFLIPRQYTGTLGWPNKRKNCGVFEKPKE